MLINALNPPPGSAPPTRNPTSAAAPMPGAPLRAVGDLDDDEDAGRGIHSSSSQLNLSASYGIGVARRGCVAHVKGVLGGV
jgi:hypothetical protein